MELIPFEETRDVLQVRRWGGYTQDGFSTMENFFYSTLGGLESSPLDSFHGHIRKRLGKADPASCRIIECVGAREDVLQYLTGLPDLKDASVILGLTRHSELADWDFMMSHDISDLLARQSPPDACRLVCAGAHAALDPEELCVCLLFAYPKAAGNGL